MPWILIRLQIKSDWFMVYHKRRWRRRGRSGDGSDGCGCGGGGGGSTFPLTGSSSTVQVGTYTLL